MYRPGMPWRYLAGLNGGTRLIICLHGGYYICNNFVLNSGSTSSIRLNAKHLLPKSFKEGPMWNSWVLSKIRNRSWLLWLLVKFITGYCWLCFSKSFLRAGLMCVYTVQLTCFLRLLKINKVFF